MTLNDKIQIARKGAVLALAKIGSTAKDAVPVLEALQKESAIGASAKRVIKGSMAVKFHRQRTCNPCL